MYKKKYIKICLLQIFFNREPKNTLLYAKISKKVYFLVHYKKNLPIINYTYVQLLLINHEKSNHDYNYAVKKKASYKN